MSGQQGQSNLFGGGSSSNPMAMPAFSFGAPNTTAPAAAPASQPGFSFGGSSFPVVTTVGANVSTPSSFGYTLGSTATATPIVPAATAASAQPGSGFSFGTAAAAAAPQMSSFSFGTSAVPSVNTTAIAAGTGAAAATPAGFQFKSPATTPTVTSSLLGTPAMTTAGATTPTFPFAAPTASPQGAAGAQNLSLGAQQPFMGAGITGTTMPSLAAATQPSVSAAVSKPADPSGTSASLFKLPAVTPASTTTPLQPQQPISTPAASTGFILGTGSTSTSSAGGPFLMGLQGFSGAAATQSIATTSAQATLPAAATSIPSGTPATTATAAMFSLGPQKATAATSTTGLTPSLAVPGFSVATTATTAPALGSMVPPITATVTTAIAAPSGTAGPGFSLAAATSTPAVGLSTATVTSASSAAGPSMSFRQLEELLNKWTLDLEEQEKVFLHEATQVNAWDHLLMTNGEKIIQLNDAVERVKLDQQQLDHELDFIHAQQRELEDILNPLEQSLENVISADPEREHTYQLAENVDAQLKRMAEDLKEVIEHLNSANKTQDSHDPIVQIGRILNAHMDSLQWIDDNTNFLQRKLQEVTKQHEIQKRDQERSFHLAYN